MAAGADVAADTDEIATAERLAGDRVALLEWGSAVRRDLPWRHTRDPWAVLVSEVMAQQTQVARVVPKWTEFLERWPTPAAFAGASLPELLELWSGLGYPRRAKALHATAQIVTAERGGQMPLELPALMALPGIGPYTARAVLAFAAEADVGVVDTNIARILARRSGSTLSARVAQLLADEFVSPGRAWEHNQSLMDLGAMLCRPTPDCEACPLSAGCTWFLAGRPDPDPARGSAGVSTRQAPFAGSDRQGRGRLLRAAATTAIASGGLAEAAGWPDDEPRALRVATDLVREGFLEIDEGGYRIAGGA